MQQIIRRDTADQTVHTLQELTYDALSRVRSRTDATSQTLTFNYNDLNKVTTVTHAEGKTDSRTYSDFCPGLVTVITDRSGATTSYDYNPAKRLITVTNPEGGAPATPATLTAPLSGSPTPTVGGRFCL
ncbi:MAG: hypothetical protein WBG37_12425 [Desulfobacterales bacterium]